MDQRRAPERGLADRAALSSHQFGALLRRASRNGDRAGDGRRGCAACGVLESAGISAGRDYLRRARNLELGVDPRASHEPSEHGHSAGLAGRAPSAGQRLCNALQRSFSDETIWVYYSKTAIVPYLRSAQLGQLGCTLPLPEARLGMAANGQEAWSEAARLLVRTTAASSDEKTRQAIRDLLMQLGNHDFAQLRQSPPLIYHNDLSAHVNRFYWSEDFGYALWLRLYEAVGVVTQ